MSWNGSGQPWFYGLTLLTGTALRTRLDQAGQYRLQVFPQSQQNCTGAGANLSVDLNVNPAVTEPESRLLVRLHFRDHLGSSMVSKAFRTAVPDGGAQGTATVTLNGTPVALHGHDPEYSFYEPFGDRLAADGGATGEARYTDHEFDGFSGLNYMKGRFQLASLAKFNRPDPMRDWDWENASSINLYQYVRNNPISGIDPTGLFELRTEELERVKEIAGPAADKVKIVEGKVDVSEFTQADLENNEGALLLSQLSESEKVFVYREGDTVETKAGVREVESGSTNLDNNFDKRWSGGKPDSQLPPEGVDSMVVINKAPQVDVATQQKEVTPRARAFHELAEAYEKVENNAKYYPSNGKKGAHQVAIEREKKIMEQRPGFTQYPAGGDVKEKK